MIRTAAAAALCGALAWPAFAQDTTALAEQYIALPSVQQMMTDMMSPEAMMAQLSAMMPAGTTLTDDQRTRLGEVLQRTLGGLRPAMEEAMVASAAGTFTAEELQAMLDFYGSEVGASVLAKTQPMMADFMGRIGPQMQAAQAAMMPEVMAIMQGG